MFSLVRRKKPQEKPAAAGGKAAKEPPRIALDESGVVVYASPAFCALAGAERPALEGADSASVISFSELTGDFRDIAAGLHKVTIKGAVFDFHFDWLTTGDGRRYLVGSETPAGAASENFREIFEPRILKARPQSSNARALKNQDFPHFLELEQDVLLVAGDNGEILRVNGAFEKMFGYGAADTEGMNIVDLLHPDDRAFAHNVLRGAELEGGKDSPPNDFECRALTCDGAERWMEWRQMRRGGLIYCAGRDVTPTKRQEWALNRRELQLREAESIGRMGRWRWGVGDKSVDWSDEIFRIFGVEKGAFRPTLDGMRGFIRKTDLPRVNQALQRAVIERNDYDMEFRIDRPDGETRYIRCEGRCAVNADDEAVALYGVMQDVTERALQEKELREAKDAAERAYAAKSQFLANMSHELRTPLNAIIGFSEMMQRQLLGPIGTEKYLEYITGIRESGEHLLDIINDILVMSKIEAGKYELMLEEISVSKTVALAAHMMEGKAMEAEVKIITPPSENEGRMIVADRRAILQVLLNLLSNAVKFSEKGGEVRIERSEGQNGAGGYVLIRVIDEGVGIPANKLASITRPFEQASAHYAREHEGTGLGLSITKDLVEMHGGGLQIESEVGVGTTVTVRLPFAGPKTESARAAQ